MERVWAAGFFDGEGCTRTAKGGEFRIQINQVDPRPLERFVAAVGVGKVLGPYSHRNPRSSTYYTLFFSGNKASLVLELLWPHLCDPKKNQARLAWEKARVFRVTPRSWHGDKLTLAVGRNLPADERVTPDK